VAPKGVPKIEITCHLDANGVLSVTAEDKDSKVKSQMTIQWNEVRLSGEDLEEAIRKANEIEDELKKAATAAVEKNLFEKWLRSLPEKIQKLVSSRLIWRSDEKITVEAIKEKKKEIQEEIIKIVSAETKQGDDESGGEL
jgi:molecular chaperone DnaK (HSP70)